MGKPFTDISSKAISPTMYLYDKIVTESSRPWEQVGQETKRTGNNIMEFFKGPGPVKPPPPPDPQPIPQADQSKAGEEQAKRLRLRRGRSKTIVTGGLTPITTRKTVLG